MKFIFNWINRIFWFAILLGSILTTTCCAYYFHIQSTLPDVNVLRNVSFETPLKIFTSDGKLIGEYGEHRRIPISYENIPEQLRNAFIATEDARFFEHYGIDPIGIARAGFVYLSTGKKAQGASTITQQIARNFFLSNKKTFTRKFQEIFLAWKIEQTLSKEEILELYLNKIALGHHSYGVAAAAYVYFGKTVDELTLGEISIIAGLPKAPSTLNPISHPKNAKARRHHVLNRMLALGMISKEQYDEADNEPIVASYHTAEIEAEAPYVAESIRQKLEDTYGDEIYTGGYRVYATINSKGQEAANRSLYDGLIEYDMRHGFRTPYNYLTENLDLNDENAIIKALKKALEPQYMTPAVVLSLNTKDKSITAYTKKYGKQTIKWEHLKWARMFKTNSYTGPNPKNVDDIVKVGDLIYVEKNNKDEYMLRQIPTVQSSLISIDTHTGSIKAMVGGFSYKQSVFNRAEQSKRQAGSNIKPFLYSAAIANNYSLATLMLDDKISIWNPWSRTNWSPKNSPNVYEGYIPLRMALAKSKNVVSVRLIRALGIENFATHLKKFGFDVHRSQKNDSLALGAYEVTPKELVTAYATFANGGYKIDPYLIERVEIDKFNQPIYQANPRIVCKNCPDAVENSIPFTPIEDIAQQLEQNNYAEQIITHGNSFLISNALKSVIFGGTYNGVPYYGTAGKARSLNRTDIAGKTGTTNDSRDAWFSGFNGNIATTVWVGFDNFSNTLGRGESGGKAALPIWINYMKVALADTPLTPVEPDKSIYTSSMFGYPEYFMKGVEVMINSPYIEDADFSTSFTTDPTGKKEETIDDIF